jgi:DNA sulfur modification protein DndD
MILKEITVNNFRVFCGKHRFDLAPKQNEENKPCIILFGGLNGSGKTSILTAVRLGLYGRQALGKATTKKDYEEYLAKSIHKKPHATVPLSGAHIELVFDYARQGVIEEFKVVRNWSNYADKHVERVVIYKNDQKLEEFNAEQ